MDYHGRRDSAFPAPRRVFTAPTYITSRPDPISSTTTGDGLVETLYNHPSVKIVAFTAGPRPVFSHGKGIAPPVEVKPGSLPWSSQLERTIAVGPFRIYRAPGSVAFLSCGSALQPILPKSQCWCVDEVSSKYVLQIRKPQYWRIEVPVTDDEEMHRAVELRAVLDKVLQFEKTECPFKRAFTVELPERPQTPVKKRPWTPVRRTSMALPPTPGTPVDVTPVDATPIWKLPDNMSESLVSEKEPVAQPEVAPLSTELGSDPDTDQQMSTEALNNDNTLVSGKVDAAVSVLEQNVQGRKDRGDVDEKLNLAKCSGFQANRSVTAPPQLTLVTAPPTASVSSETVTEEVAVLEPALERSESRSPTGSHDSFHSVGSWTSPAAPLPPSPPLTAAGSPNVLPYPQQYLFVAKKLHHQDTSSLTITRNTPLTLNGSSSDEIPTEEHPQQTSVLDDELSSTCSVTTADDSLHSPTSTVETDVSSAPTVSNTTGATSSAIPRTTSDSSSSSTVFTRRPYMRHRPTTSSSISPNRGALPRLPSAADLFPSYRTSSQSYSGSHSKPQPPGRLSLVRRLPMAVIQKTCEILFSPPSHLITLMLKVAARIAAGEWRGYMFGFGEGGERIPVRWDWSDEDDDGEGELGGWGADEDWEFARSGRTTSGFRMAGAFPESPEREEDEQLGAEEDGLPGSPSLERKMRSLSQSQYSNAASEPDRDGDDEKDGAHADWTGSLSVD